MKFAFLCACLSSGPSHFFASLRSLRETSSRVASLHAAAALCLTLGTAAQAQKAPAVNAAGRPYQDLIIPEALTGTNFDLDLHKSSRSFWKGAITATYAYNKQQFWGPTLILNQGDNVKINVHNRLDEETTAHWHGLHIPAKADGGPHQIIPAGSSWSAEFTVKNRASTYWYHPHVHEKTQKQLTYGAGGFIIIRDPQEAALPLPRSYGVDDIPLVFTSRRFYKNDQFSFEADNDKYGDFLLANGVLDAQVKLPAQFVRLRILNTETERGYDIAFQDNRTFYLIATDGGLVDKPVPLKRMMLMTGERAEIIVDLSKDKVGSSIDLLANNANHPFGFPGGEPGTGRPNGSYLNNITFPMLHINVGERTAHPVLSAPAVLAHNRYWTEKDATKQRTFHITGQPGSPFAFDNVAYSMHTKPEVVKLGDTEAWTIVNNQVFGHSFHIHDVQFSIVSRSSGAVQEWEKGWKDTLYVPRSESVTFVARFRDFSDPATPYMYHCHMSNHEDGGLMGEFVVATEAEIKSGAAVRAIEFRERREHTLTEALLRTASIETGRSAAPFNLADADGKAINFRLLCASKPVVLFFIELNCPCSRDAAPYLSTIQAEYGDACSVIGIVNGSAEEARAWQRQTGAKFRVVPDPELKIINTYHAERSVYTTLIAPGGKIQTAYPGYSASMLKELSTRIAALSGAKAITDAFETAPKTLTTGCPYAIKK